MLQSSHVEDNSARYLMTLFSLALLLSITGEFCQNDSHSVRVCFTGSTWLQFHSCPVLYRPEASLHLSSHYQYRAYDLVTDAFKIGCVAMPTIPWAPTGWPEWSSCCMHAPHGCHPF